MIGAAAARHRIFIQPPQTRRGFARVQNKRAIIPRHPREGFRGRGNGRHALRKVQGGPFRRQQRPRRPAHPQQSCARRGPFAIGNKNVHLHIRIHRAKHFRRNPHPGHNHVLTRHQSGAGRGVIRHQRQRSGIAAANILLQRPRNQLAQVRFLLQRQHAFAHGILSRLRLLFARSQLASGVINHRLAPPFLHQALEWVFLIFKLINLIAQQSGAFKLH